MTGPRPPEPERFAPHATREMARMFDGVTARYALLNRIMTLGQDAAWRRAMWSAVPETARVVLDLCTGDGSSLPGLRRPGRLVIGLDVSLRMLQAAAGEERRTGWAPRLVGGDAFRLPFRNASIDAVTVAFGMRNLRPQAAAVAEIARVLRPSGTLVVLEATGPDPGPTAPLHRFWLSRVVPLLGRLSPDPSAYRYLADSVLEFGPGDAFLVTLPASGFDRPAERSFLMGATRLWVARRGGAGGVQAARDPGPVRSEMPPPAGGRAEERTWSALQMLLSVALAVSLAWVAAILTNPEQPLPLDRSRRVVLGFLAAGTAAFFLIRAIRSFHRLRRPGPRA